MSEFSKGFKSRRPDKSFYDPLLRQAGGYTAL